MLPATTSGMASARATNSNLGPNVGVVGAPYTRISCMGFSTYYGSSYEYPLEFVTISSSLSSSSIPNGARRTISHHTMIPLIVSSTMEIFVARSNILGSS